MLSNLKINLKQSFSYRYLFCLGIKPGALFTTYHSFAVFSLKKLKLSKIQKTKYLLTQNCQQIENGSIVL